MKKLTLIALALVFVASPAFAQDDEAVGDEPQESYAWGEGETARPVADAGEDPLRIQAFVGAGFGVRLLRNLDSPFVQTFIVPPYLDFGAIVFAPGAEIRHGGGLTLSMNLTEDGDPPQNVGPGEQWAITPAYHLMIPLQRLMPDLGGDWLQIQAHLGVPIVIGTKLGDDSGGVDVSVGLELGAGVVFKFLAGLGLYLDIDFALYGGTANTVHPLLAFDLGFVIDYEVLQ